MNVIERFGPWIAAAALVIAVVWIAGAMASGRRRRSSSRTRTEEPGDNADFRALDQKVNQVLAEVRHATQQQAEQMGELRTFWANRLQSLESRIEQWMRSVPGTTAPAPGDALPRLQAASNPPPVAETGISWTERDRAQPQPQPDAWLRTVDAGGYGADSLRASSSSSPEGAWTAGPGDRPVEIREGVLVASMSLPPAAYVALEAGRARVYLNPDAPINEFALPKWEAFFDLSGARPYAAYRTRRPAEVRWDDAAARGELIAKGTAEAI